MIRRHERLPCGHDVGGARAELTHRATSWYGTYMTTNRPRPLILDSFADVDNLSTPTTITIPGKNLREGMVIVDDELGAPCAGLDHKIGRAAHGQTTWFVADLDTGRWYQTMIGHRTTVRVVAA